MRTLIKNIQKLFRVAISKSSKNLEKTYFFDQKTSLYEVKSTLEVISLEKTYFGNAFKVILVWGALQLRTRYTSFLSTLTSAHESHSGALVETSP